MMTKEYLVEDLLGQINEDTKLGDLRKIAKEIKQDHALAMKLWASKVYLARLLAILIMDKKLLTEEVLEQLDEDMQIHTASQRNTLMDWLMSNQLTKHKKGKEMIQSWQHSQSALQRRAFWYYQGRLRWTGKTPPNNTAELLSYIEDNIMAEEPEVQWAMNFVAGWIGVYDTSYRERCIQLGERTGLYRGDHVSKGCTPNYLPEFIEIEASKRNI